MNMSWSASDLHELRNAIAQAIKAGVVVVTSAGNQGVDGGGTPCGYSDVICVGGVTNQYEKAAESNYGTGVTIFAPSQELRGPSHKGDLQWVVDSGTSFAAPAVAAIASIFISFETIRGDVKKVLQRLEQNWHTGILVDTPENPAKPNILLHTGMEHPNRDNKFPYTGPDPNADGAGFESNIDGASM
jgi:subtilisin family serine protease